MLLIQINIHFHHYLDDLLLVILGIKILFPMLKQIMEHLIFILQLLLSFCFMECHHNNFLDNNCFYCVLFLKTYIKYFQQLCLKYFNFLLYLDIFFIN